MRLEHHSLLKILIVDDQSSDILGPSMLSHHLGYHVTLAFDGKQALLETMRSDYDLVILDWNMPVMSGGQFLAYIEQADHFTSSRKMNVILHSGDELPIADFPNSSKYKIVDVWHKPLGVLEMLKRIKQVRDVA